MYTPETHPPRWAKFEDDGLGFLEAPTDVEVMKWLSNALEEALSEGSIISGKTMMEWLAVQDPPMTRCEHVSPTITDSTLLQALEALRFGLDPDSPWADVYPLYDRSLSSIETWLNLYVAGL